MNTTIEYRSNNGKGPLRARLVAADNRTVTLERWDERSKRKRRTVFKLPRRFFVSASCGWKEIVQ